MSKSQKYSSELIEELKLLAEAFIADAEAFIADAEALIDEYKKEEHHGRN